MKIGKNSVVKFHYRLRDETAGREIESTHEDGEPVLYIHGTGGIIPGLEEAMAEKETGDIFSVSVAPEQGYGPRRENSEQRIPIKHLLVRKNTRLSPGMIVHVQTDHGARQATVIKAGKFNVDVDTNHPLAGKQLGFDIEIVDVRQATAEEIAHGHVHGDGGCGH